MKKFTTFLVLITLSILGCSQNKFQLSYAQTGQDFNDLNSIKKLSDGYIMVGTCGSTSSNLNDIVVMKTDLNMTTLWSKTIGMTAFDEKIEYMSKCVVFETDGIVILGNTNQPGTRDFLLTKVDYSGSVLWSKSYGCTISGSNYNDNASVICKTSNGYYLCGYLTNGATGYGLVIKVDNSGAQQWSKYFIPQSGVGCTLWSGVGLKNNDLVVGGGFGNGAWDSYLLYITSTGSILWQKTFAKSNYDIPYDLAEDADNTVLCAMMHDGYFTGARGALMNVDLTTGTLNWAKNYDLDLVNDRDGQMVSVVKNPDNTTMIGFIYSNLAAGAFTSDIAVAKLDAGANVIWAKKYGSNDADAWPKIFPADGNYLVCAERANNRYPSDHFYLLGLNSDGKVGCNETTLNPVVTPLTDYTWVNFTTSLVAFTPTVATQSLISNTTTIDKNVLCINSGLETKAIDGTVFSITPNPAHNEIKVSGTENINKIEILNILGQVLVTSEGQQYIDISKLPKGTYIIRVNDSYTTRFVKE